MGRYRVVRAVQVKDDFARIADHLFLSHRTFGDDPADAMKKAVDWVGAARRFLRALADLPHRGTLHADIGPGIRSVTKDRFVYYFTIDETRAVVTILAVYFGGTDHRTRIVDRLRSIH